MIKNILIFTAIGVIFIFIFIFFIKKSPEGPALVSNSSPSGATSSASSVDAAITQDFLSLLLNVQNIKLDGSIFSDPAFTSLRDSSIVLVADGTEGRPNPFAPIGSEGGGTSQIPPKTAIPPVTPPKTTPKPPAL